MSRPDPWTAPAICRQESKAASVNGMSAYAPVAAHVTAPPTPSSSGPSDGSSRLLDGEAVLSEVTSCGKDNTKHTGKLPGAFYKNDRQVI